MCVPIFLIGPLAQNQPISGLECGTFLLSVIELSHWSLGFNDRLVIDCILADIDGYSRTIPCGHSSPPQTQHEPGLAEG